MKEPGKCPKCGYRKLRRETTAAMNSSGHTRSVVTCADCKTVVSDLVGPAAHMDADIEADKARNAATDAPDPEPAPATTEEEAKKPDVGPGE